MDWSIIPEDYNLSMLVKLQQTFKQLNSILLIKIALLSLEEEFATLSADGSHYRY